MVCERNILIFINILHVGLLCNNVLWIFFPIWSRCSQLRNMALSFAFPTIWIFFHRIDYFQAYFPKSWTNIIFPAKFYSSKTRCWQKNIDCPFNTALFSLKKHFKIKRIFWFHSDWNAKIPSFLMSFIVIECK